MNPKNLKCDAAITMSPAMTHPCVSHTHTNTQRQSFQMIIRFCLCSLPTFIWKSLFVCSNPLFLPLCLPSPSFPTVSLSVYFLSSHFHPIPLSLTVSCRLSPVIELCHPVCCIVSVARGSSVVLSSPVIALIL